MKSSTATVLAALLVAVVLVAPSAAASPRRALLNSCEDECTKTYEDNVKKCIAETKLGEPPALEKKQAVAMGALAYVPPKDTGFQLAEKECRRLQDPELTKCKAGCNKKDCVAIGKKCDDSFDKGTMLAAWCRQKEGC